MTLCPRWVRRVWPHSPNGPWIPYPDAVVKARRAAQMVLIVACAGGASVGGYKLVQQMPPGWMGIPPTVEAPHPVPLWHGLPPIDERTPVPVHTVPEPASAALLGVGVLALWWRRRG